LADPAATADLIAFLQALPEGRKRRGVRYPQWLLLLMAIPVSFRKGVTPGLPFRPPASTVAALVH